MSTPIPRGAVVLGKYLAYLACSVFVVLPSVVLVWLLVVPINGSLASSFVDMAKDLVEPYVLNDFAKEERPWVEAVCSLIADNAELLARGEDSSFQNKVHLAMDAKGFGPELPGEGAN